MSKTSRAMEIRKEIVKLSEEYERWDENAGLLNRYMCECIKADARRLIREFEGLLAPQSSRNPMNEILLRFGKLVLETTETSNMDELRYFIYDERPITEGEEIYGI